MSVTPALATPYGTLPDGRPSHLYTLTNQNGMVARITDYGATLISLEVPDRNGKPADITLGYDTFDDLLKDPHYHGSTVGRFGNRIAFGSFSLNGDTHSLVTNNDPGGIPCHLHGGTNGFNQKLWDGKQEGNKVTLKYTSPDGEEGYPGTLACVVTYELTDDNELIWTATATTDRATPVNLINHTYWNLTGNPTHTILNHELTIPADTFLDTNDGMIPNGPPTPVRGTPFDFSAPTKIGEHIEDDFPALVRGNGYDHCFVLNNTNGLCHAATAHDPSSGRTMEVYTNQPGVHFYTGNYLDTSVPGIMSVRFGARTGFCLETEAFPDAPNQSGFPSSILNPGETYSHTMSCRFSW